MKSHASRPGQGGAGELEWIAALTPEIAEAPDRPQEPVRDAAAVAHGERIRAKAPAERRSTTDRQASVDVER